MSKRANLIILHGASSSGKTDVAHALHSLFPDYDHEHLHRFVNDIARKQKSQTKRIITHMEFAASKGFLTESLFTPIKHDAKYIWDQAIEKMKRNLVKKLHNGKSIIFEGILQTKGTCENFFKAFTQHRVILIKIDAPFETVQTQEKHRKNRINGWAKTHYFTMHKNKTYDLELRTDTHSPQECAKRIKQWIDTCQQQ